MAVNNDGVSWVETFTISRKLEVVEIRLYFLDCSVLFFYAMFKTKLLIKKIIFFNHKFVLFLMDTFLY